MLRSQAVLSPHDSARVSSQVSTFTTRAHVGPNVKSIPFEVLHPDLEPLGLNPVCFEQHLKHCSPDTKPQLPGTVPSSPTNIAPSVPSPTVAPSTLKNFSPPILTAFPPPPRAASQQPAGALDVESIRADLTKQLEQAKETNRQLYMSSARRMIEMQEKIDALTKENVKLIRSLAPQSMQW